MPYASSIQVINDANGTAYAFLADNGLIWQCQWNGEAQRWDKGQAVPGAVGGEKLQALVLDNLWPTESGGSSGNATTGNNPGIVLAYRVGEGSSAEIVASFGQWGSDGQLGWSAPVQLTDDQVEEQAFSLTQGTGGGFSLVVQKQQAATPANALLDKLANTPADRLEAELKAAASGERPDSDLYATQFAIAADPSGGLQLNDLTAGRTQALSPTLPFSSIASSPRAFSGNTQLSRQQLITQPAPAAQPLSAGPLLLQSSEPTSPAGVGWQGWQGGAAGQANFSNGGSLRVGLLVGQNLLRWQLPNQKSPLSLEEDPLNTSKYTRSSGSVFSHSSSSFLTDSGADFGSFGEPQLLGIADDASGFESFVNESRGTFAEILNPPPSELADDIAPFTRPRASSLASVGLAPMASGGISLFGYRGSDQNPVHVHPLLRGVIGLANVGRGGPTVLSAAKALIDVGNNDRPKIFQDGLMSRGEGETGWTKVKSGFAVGGGGDLQTIYQYQGKGKPYLVSLQSEESIGADFESTSLRFSDTGGSLMINTAVSSGWLFEQTLTSAEGGRLPSWLADLGYAGGAAADLEKTGFGGYGALFGGYSPGKGLNSYSGVLGSPIAGNGRRNLQGINAGVGSALAALGPATAITAAVRGGLGTDSELTHGSGLNLFTRLTGRWLYKSVLGLQFTVANKLVKFLAGEEKGVGTDNFYASFGLALPLGGSVPLLSYSLSKSWGGDESHQSSDNTPQALAANSSGITGTTTSTDNPSGAYISATSGEAYPFLYAPQSGSNSYFSAATSTAQNNVALLGGQATTLQLLTLQPTAIGAINPANTAGSNALSLYNPGSGLNDGSYANVPILGVTADGDLQTAAKASFTVQGGSIQASSFQIVSGGSYLALPETQPNSGTYALVLDVYSTGIATPPDPSGNLGNIFADLPLITLTSNSTNPPPLQIQDIQRVSSVPVNPADQPANLLYPQYDPKTQQTTAPSATQNSLYTYNNVPVQLFSSTSSTTAIPLLNPGATSADPANSVTATVTLSGGVIQRVALDQPLLVANGAIDTATSLRLSLPDAVVSSLPKGSLPPSFSVVPEALGFNNVVADEQFSAQPDVANAGVFLASGISDALPLTGAMAAWPVQNRVTYVTTNGSGQSNVVYLNGRVKDAQAPTGYATKLVVEPDDLSLLALYKDTSGNDLPVFSAASTPTAITIEGPATSKFGGDTFVAWVEAADPVIPATMSGNGAANFQNFMDALYGNQQINYRINAAGTTGWEGPANLSSLYKPENAVIRHLQAFNVPKASASGGLATLLVWTETSLDAIKDSGFEGWIEGTKLTVTTPGVSLSVGDLVSGIGVGEPASIKAVNSDGTYNLGRSLMLGSAESSVILRAIEPLPTVIKAGWINPNASNFGWNSLLTDASGNSSIQTIPWDQDADVGLTIEDISIASKLLLQADGSIAESPLITWSQEVRTPYRQSVLNDQPNLYLQFGELQSGISDINIGSVNSTYTSTFASDTGLNFTIAGALPKSQATAVQNVDGTGVLSTGLGSTFASIRQIASNIPASSLAAGSAIARFTGAISGDTLTVSALTAGRLDVGDLLAGPGVLAGTTIQSVGSVDQTTGLGTYRISQRQSLAVTDLQAIEASSQLPLSSFTGSISGSTLSVSDISQGDLAVGDLITGPGIPGGTTIIAVNTFDLDNGTGSFLLDKSFSEAVASSALVASPGVPSNPYTIEFWAQLSDSTFDNPNGAGLVALGQPSDAAVGAPELPEGWLLNASFVVDRVSYQQAAASGLISSIPTSISDPGETLYGWEWGVVATGANTTAMDGNGGSNLYNNALLLNNLVSGSTLAGVTQFLANYGLTPEDLSGIDNSDAATIASVPTTQLEFSNAIDSSTGLPNSSLNTIAVDTSTALLNEGLVTASGGISSELSAMFTALWDFQQATGEAKVNFSLAPDSPNVTTPSSGALPSGLSTESYSGYQLSFALARGTAISVNGSGQLVFDVGQGTSITSEASGTVPADLRDGNWHYIVASFLPTFQTYDADGVTVQLPTNIGTASLYVDNQLVASNTNVFNPYPLINLNDQAQLLANNAKGAIDQLAFYDKALSSAAFSPNLSGDWPTPNAQDALGLLASLGYDIATKTPDPGAIPGAVSKHWEARNVNPNAAAQATYTSSFDASTNSWSQASSLNALLQVDPSLPSYSSGGSLQDGLVIAVPTASWTSSGWQETTSSSTKTDGFFNPANQELTGVTVTLTNLTDTTEASVTIALTPDQVLIGNQSLQSLQPMASDADFNYTVLSNTPAFSLVIPKDQLPADKDDRLKDQYSATYSFNFVEGSNTVTVGTTAAVDVNTSASSLAAMQATGVVSAKTLTRLQDNNKAIATAQVIEQAPLQLKYVDSGVVLKSAETAAGANNPADFTPADSFGQSQVFGSFNDSSGNTNGWLAIAQPFSTNALSDPAGRVWINYTGQSKSGTPSTTTAQAPTTWLNALANSNFSPATPNLPLLGDANNPSSSGGLLIKADPTAGWGQNFGQTMLVADVNQDGISDLIIAAPQANGGGRVVIVDGQWIKTTLTSSGGATTLDLSNPSGVGSYVTVLTPADPASSNDQISVANFGSALAFDGTTLWIGAPNYLSQVGADGTDSLQSLVPIGALYRYSTSATNPNGWDTGTAPALANPILGSAGTTITNNASGAETTAYWGSQFGTAIAVNSSGGIAVSAPGVQASLLYSGTQAVRESANGKKNPSDPYGDGALVRIQLPSSSNNNSVSSTQGVNNPGLIDVGSQSGALSSKESTYMQNLRALQQDPIVGATYANNQAIQTGEVGAVYLFGSSSDLTALTTAVTPEAVAAASKGGATFYGAMPWNTLGASGFGSSLSFGDFNNTNSNSILAIGAPQTGGSGALYLVDTSQGFINATASQTSWIKSINLAQGNQYLAHLASGLTLYGADSADNFGNGLVDLGDVNDDGYSDLLIQAYNASSGAGNGYVLFGNDQIFPASSAGPNPASGSVASGSIGQLNRADGKPLNIAILTELGYGNIGYTGQGTFGGGDINGDGINDIPLGSGPNGNAYLTWGQTYLEAIDNLQLSKLTSDSGFMLDGLATANQGSLRSIGDFNGDGYGDFISIRPGNALTSVRIELGANTQEILADAPYNFYTFTVANGTQVLPGGDINGDGMDDIVLFLDQNLSSAADGNSGAGSTTGILYGRSSIDLPLGAGFGFIAPVDPTTSAPLAPLPGLAVEKSDGEVGLTDATASVIAVGNTLYAAVKGKGDNTLWFTQSRDGGNSWSNWTELGTVNSGFATSTGPSLAFFENELYLGFLNLSGTLSLSSWDPASNNLSAWSAPTALSDSSNAAAVFSSAYGPQLLDRGDVLGMVWVDTASGTLKSSGSSMPDGKAGSWTSPTTVLQRLEANDGASFVAISATAAPTATWLGGVPVLAVSDNGSINVYAGAQSGSSLQLTSSFTAPSGGPAISSAPVLTSTPTGLALTYTNADGSISLNRLSFVADDGTPLPGVQFNADGSINTSNADLQWQSTVLNEGNSGLSTSLASTPVSVNGNLLLTNIRNSSSQDDQIWINAVPNLSDASSTIWLNSSVQLPNGSGGWSFQQKGGTVNIGTLTPDWKGDAGGLSPSAPSFTELNGVLYAAVVGYSNGSANGLMYWNSSSDGGRTWGSWQQVPNYASDQAPALAAYQGNIYMAYVGTNSGVYIAELTDPGTNSWSQVQAGNQTCQYIGLTSENGELAAYYVGTNSELYRTATTTPSRGSSWTNSMVIQYSGGDQTASGNLAVTTIPGSGSSSDTTYIAYQGGTPSSPSDTLYLTYSSTQSNGNSSSWSEASISTQPSTANRGGVTLSHNSAGLLLGYPDKVNGEVAYVLQQSTNSGSTWTSFTTLAAPTGNTLPSSGGYSSFNLLASPNSNDVLVGAINNGSGDNDAIYTAIVSELPPSTNLTSSRTQSNLSAVGDLNGDGFDDLLVAANNVVVNPSSSSPTLATGLRLISGAATSDQLLAANNASSTSQNVQLAPWRGLNNTTPVASLSGSRQLSVTTTDSVSGLSLSSSAEVSPSTAFTATAGDLATAQSLFKPSADVTLGNPPAGPRLGDLGLISTGGFGDLDGNGFVDHLDPTSATVLTGAYNQTWNLWSIRAAGDVNGNGVDDVLLSLAPQGPAYVQTSSGQPSALMSVLVDGYLFKVDSTSNSFRLDQLKTPLNPYNRSEVYDITSTSTSDYAPALQNWFDPIHNYEPGSISSSSLPSDGIVNLAGAESYSPPSVAFGRDGEPFFFFSGADNFDSSKNGSGLWYAYQASGSWIQNTISICSNASSFAPSAAFYDGSVYVAYSDINGDIWVASSDTPEDTSSWTKYQVKTSTDESTASSPTLIAESGRLALYFPTNNSRTNQQNVRYLYSRDPGDSTSWGGTLKDGIYTEISGQMQIGGTTQIVTSPIAATTYQGRTVLAFRGYNASGSGSNIGNGTMQILTQDYTETAGSAPSPTSGWTLFDTGLSNVNGVGLTTDQALLYLSSSGSYDSYYPSSNIWSLSPIKPGSSTWNAPARTNLSGSSSLANSFAYGVMTPYMLNGKLMAAWTNSSYQVQVSPLDVSVSAAAQQSLAGYSLDGNIDINGDGFKDVLISDPSDPEESVDNQYALFGGDYLNIASQVGTPGNDDLVGSPLADVIYSLGGSDVVISAGGNDVIYTGSGDDQISISDSNFIRIDAGSGFDKLLLEGGAGQNYSFNLNVDYPEYFAGTKLRNIELISSQDYGSNTLSFDAAAVNAINPDRILFLTPDTSDFIALSSEFQRNSSFDTTYGGVLWNAYASGEQTSPTSDSPALVYVLNPEGATNANWLSTNVTINSAAPSSTSLRAALAAPLGATDSSSESPIPTTSAVHQSVSFGSTLTLTSYRTKASDGLARFSISSSDTSKPRALLYAISSSNSSAEPGRDYTAIAGVAVLAKDESSFDITVPIDSEAFSQLRNGTLSLRVEEISYSDQLESIHLLIEPTPAPDGGLPPVLSGLSLSLDSSGSTATLELRADTHNGSADAFNLSIARRNSADTVAVIQRQLVLINDFKPVPGDLPPAYNLQNLDHDGRPNQQVQTSLLLNLKPTGNDPLVSLLGPELNWQTTVQLLNGNQVRFQQDAPLTSWRADSSAGLVTFGLQSGSNKLTLISNAQGGSAGSLNSNNANGATSWQSTEGKAIGSRSITDGQNLKGSDWTPTASRGGVSLALLNLAVDGNQVTASFEGGVTGVFWQADGNAPSLLPAPVSVEVQRLAGYNNSLGFYSVDSITGMVDGINPGENGYLQAALARSQEEDLLLNASTLPAFGATATFNSLPLDTRERYGVLLLQNGDRSVIFSSFAAANEGGATQMVSLSDSSNSRVLGIEDLSVAKGLGDNDFNDIIVKFQGVSLGLF